MQGRSMNTSYDEVPPVECARYGGGSLENKLPGTRSFPNVVLVLHDQTGSTRSAAFAILPNAVVWALLIKRLTPLLSLRCCLLAERVWQFILRRLSLALSLRPTHRNHRSIASRLCELGAVWVCDFPVSKQHVPLTFDCTSVSLGHLGCQSHRCTPSSDVTWIISIQAMHVRSVSIRLPGLDFRTMLAFDEHIIVATPGPGV